MALLYWDWLYIGERFGENGVGGKWLMGALLRIPLTLSGQGNGVVGDEIILLNCCKWLQINRTFFQAATVLSEGKSRYLSSQDQSGTKNQSAALPISASRDGPPAFNLPALPAALCRRVSIVRTDTGTAS